MFGIKKKPADGTIGNYKVKHLQGLPIPEVACEVNLFPDCIRITAAGNEYSLHINQISDISFDMNVDIQKYSSSSILAGVAGAALFGVAGAVIGSAPKKKEARMVTCVAIIAYQNSSGDHSYLIFQDAETNSLQAAKLHDKLKPLISQKSVHTVNL